MNKTLYKVGVALAVLHYPVYVAVRWLYYALIGEGQAGRREFQLSLGRNVSPADRGFWLWLTSVAIMVLVLSIWAWFGHNHFVDRSKETYPPTKDAAKKALASAVPVETCRVFLGIALVVLVISLGMIGAKTWYNDDTAVFYNTETEFLVSDVENPPPALQWLFDGASAPNNDRCTRVGKHDIPSCINEETYSQQGWLDRSASLAGATKIMGQASGENQNANLLTETMAHLYSTEDVPEGTTQSAGYWSGIRDGVGKETDIEGVIEWDGSGAVRECVFKGEHELNRAFRGQRGNNLMNFIAERFPRVRFRLTDVYGYCDGAKRDVPVVVIPTFTNTRQGATSVEVASGVIIMKGSPSGEPSFDFKQSVKQGELPGPVYPLSIAEKQREQVAWAAGRKNKEANSFGFDSTDAASQAGNATEFLLKSQDDGRVYWVTPLTLKSADSQIIVAYSLVPADVVNGGELNRLRVFALDNDSPHRVNLNQMQRDLTDFVSRERDGFFTQDGATLQEFTPSDGTSWRIFGTLDGDPRFVIQYDPASEESRPTLTELRDDGSKGRTEELETDTPGEDNPSLDGSVCASKLEELSDADLVACAQAALDELAARSGE